MRRPRWHDALIALGILGIAGSGVWAFWGDDVARALGLSREPAVEKATPSAAAS